MHGMGPQRSFLSPAKGRHLTHLFSYEILMRWLGHGTNEYSSKAGQE